jgi:hypothetical protein
MEMKMRKIIVLGVSAAVLALGIVQASAGINGHPAQYLSALAAASTQPATQPAYTGELRDVQTNNFSTLDANARHVGH